MKSIIAIRLFFINLKSKFSYQWKKYFQTQKYYGTAQDLLKEYRAEHPKATSRMAKRHVERELRKRMKKDGELKKHDYNFKTINN